MRKDAWRIRCLFLEMSFDSPLWLIKSEKVFMWLTDILRDLLRGDCEYEKWWMANSLPGFKRDLVFAGNVAFIRATHINIYHKAYINMNLHWISFDLFLLRMTFTGQDLQFQIFIFLCNINRLQLICSYQRIITINVFTPGTCLQLVCRQYNWFVSNKVS